MKLITYNSHIIFAFSDTHGNHHKISVPEEADILICAGDAVEDDLKGDEYDDFIEWFAAHPAKWKLFVPGNHELSFEINQADAIKKKMKDNGIHVMQDAVCDCDGIIIASLDANSVISDEDIPADLDILVTHCPPYGILDEDMGSVEILNFLMKSQPSYHLFGHIHTTQGQRFQYGKTYCINVAYVF